MPANSGTGLDGRASALLARAGWNGMGSIAALGAQLALTPYLLHRLGLDRYGIWALIGVLVTFVSATDGGLGGSLTFFFSQHRGERDYSAVSRLVVSTAMLFLLFGGLITLVLGALMPSILTVTKVPTALRPEAMSLRFLIGPLVTAGFLWSLFAALLQAHDRYRAIGLISAVRGALMVAGSVAAIGQGGGLRALLLVNIGASLAATTIAAMASSCYLSAAGTELLRAHEWKALWQYASRMQLSSMTALVMLELDALIIGMLLSVRYVGIYSIGANVAVAAKALPMYLLGPLFTRFALHYSQGRLEGVAAVYRRINPLWFAGILTYDAVGVAGLYFGVKAWLGPGHSTSAVVASLLFAGYGINLLTGVSSAFVRAIGKPGLETRYALWSTLINLALTIPLGLAFGLYGVVASTVVGTAIGSLYFFRILRRSVQVDLGSSFTELRPALTNTVILFTFSGELVVAALGYTGLGGLGLTAVPAAAGLIIYLWFSRLRFAELHV